MTRLLAFALSAAVAALLLSSVASAHYKPRGKDCGSIAFTPNSDDGSSEIRAKGTSCRRARKIVRRWERGNKSPFGYTCRDRAHDPAEGLAHSDVKCTRGDKRVTWAAF
jgi:hypothetical protein